MITLQIQHWQSQFFTNNHRGLRPYFLERLRKVQLFRSPGWPTLCPEHRGWGCRRETKDAAGPLDNPSSDGEGGVLTVHHVTKVPSPRTSRSSWNVAERVQEGPGCSSPWGCLFSFNKEREWKAWECSTYILQSIMRILTCSPLWKALMKRRKRASGWPRGERSLAACHSRGRAEKVGDQRAVTELGPCPSRKPRRAGSAATLRNERRGSRWSPRVPSSETNGHVVTSRFPWVLSLFWPSHSLSSEKNIQTGSLARRTLDFPWMSLRTILLEAWSPALLPSFKRGPSGRRPPTPRPACARGSACLTPPWPSLLPALSAPEPDTPGLAGLSPVSLDAHLPGLLLLFPRPAHTWPLRRARPDPCDGNPAHARAESARSFSYGVTEHPTLFSHSI